METPNQHEPHGYVVHVLYGTLDENQHKLSRGFTYMISLGLFMQHGLKDNEKLDVAWILSFKRIVFSDG